MKLLVETGNREQGTGNRKCTEFFSKIKYESYSIENNLSPAAFKNLIVYFVHLENARPKLEALKKVIERDKIKLLVGMTFPLNQVAQAEQKLEEGGVGVHGKIVV